MSIKRGMDKDVAHIYSGILLSHKKNEILPFATTWTGPGCIMLSEISQTEKGKYCILSLICGTLKVKQTRDYNNNSSRKTDS